jgi:hypothetical protein
MDACRDRSVFGRRIVENGGGCARGASPGTSHPPFQAGAVQAEDRRDVPSVEPLDGARYQGRSLPDVERGEARERGRVDHEVLERRLSAVNWGHRACCTGGAADDLAPEPGGGAFWMAELGRASGASAQRLRRQPGGQRLVAQRHEQREAVEPRTVQLAERGAQPLLWHRAGGRKAVRRRWLQWDTHWIGLVQSAVVR